MASKSADYQLRKRLEKTKQAANHIDQKSLFDSVEQKVEEKPDLKPENTSKFIGKIGIFNDEVQIRRNEYFSFKKCLGSLYFENDEIKVIYDEDNCNVEIARLKVNEKSNLIQMLKNSQELKNLTNIDFKSAKTESKIIASGHELTANGLLVPMTYEETYITVGQKS